MTKLNGLQFVSLHNSPRFCCAHTNQRASYSYCLNEKKRKFCTKKKQSFSASQYYDACICICNITSHWDLYIAIHIYLIAHSDIHTNIYMSLYAYKLSTPTPIPFPQTQNSKKLNKSYYYYVYSYVCWGIFVKFMLLRCSQLSPCKLN